MGIFSWYRKLSPATQILLFMVLGVVVGLVFGKKATVLQPFGDLFIRLLMMAAIPLVFFNMLAGLATMTDIKILGKIGARILAFYLLTTACAVTIGLVAANIFQPGIGMTLTSKVSTKIGAVPGVSQILLDLVPKNAFAAFSTGNVAQIVVFAAFLGIVTLLMPPATKNALEKGYTLLADLFRKLIGVLLHYAPIGIGALAADTVGRYGSQVFGPLAKFVGTCYVGHFSMFLIYMILLVVLARESPIDFLKKSGPLYATTAATCSSLASLAVSLDIAEKRFKLPKSIYSFTLPLGAQINKDGTSIMLTAVLMFTAQAAGVTFDIPTQLSIILVGLILSEGTGGIPGGGLVVAMVFVQAFNLPLEITAMVAGVYRLVEMGNTTINCMGDLVGTVIVAKHAHIEPEDNNVVA